jgi:hypothetical protein
LPASGKACATRCWRRLSRSAYAADRAVWPGGNLTLDLASEGSKHAPQASEIRQHVLNTTRLVNNLLDMARIQSGGFNLKRVADAGRGGRQRAAMLEPASRRIFALPDPLSWFTSTGRCLNGC